VHQVENITKRQSTMFKVSSRRTTHRRMPRRGVVTVEFAIVFPLVLMVVFGSVEFARLNMLVNSIENAAYEGARRGIVPGATAANSEAEAAQLLQAVGAVNATVTVAPAVITPLTSEVTVTVTLPLNDNAWVTPRFTKGRSIVRSCTLSRERTSAAQ
jgi:Flp pilus assembly protein TadG